MNTNLETSTQPINRDAAKVFRKGDKLTVTPDDGREHWEVCPEMYTNEAAEELNPMNYHLIGQTKGRFTVMGLSKEFKPKFVVRCQCGRFELRRSKALSNPKNNDDSCFFCNMVSRGISKAKYKSRVESAKGILKDLLNTTEGETNDKVGKALGLLIY